LREQTRAFLSIKKDLETKLEDLEQKAESTQQKMLSIFKEKIQLKFE